VNTQNVFMNVTLSIDDEVMREARRRAEALGISVNQLVRDYLEAFVGKRDPRAQVAELRGSGTGRREIRTAGNSIATRSTTGGCRWLPGIFDSNVLADEPSICSDCVRFHSGMH
jgi:hypothetical protein